MLAVTRNTHETTFLDPWDCGWTGKTQSVWNKELIWFDQDSWKYKELITLDVSDLRIISGVCGENSKEFGLTLNGFRTVSH